MNNLSEERDTILQFFTQLLQNSIDFSSLDTSEISALNEIRDSFLSMSDEEQLEIRSDSSHHLRDEQEKAIEAFLSLRNKWITENEINKDGYNFEISDLLKSCIVIVYHQTNKQLEIDLIVNDCYRYRCGCVYHMTPEIVKKVIKKCILLIGDIPDCEMFPNFIEYYLLHSTIPNEEELDEYMRRVYEFSRNPEEFHQTDKCLVPTLHVEKLPVFDYKVSLDEVDVCCICQEEFTTSQKVIKLVPCGHLFHHSINDCLENGSILNWLSANNRCPLCKIKIEVKG